MKVECVEARLGLGAGSLTGLFLFLVFRWSAEGQDRSANLVCGCGVVWAAAGLMGGLFSGQLWGRGDHIWGHGEL